MIQKLNLKKEILNTMIVNGIINLSPIQNVVLEPILSGRDVIYQARSGSGKTTCYIIAINQMIQTNQQIPQILVLIPTRELAIQINNTINSFGYQLNNKAYACYGGKWIGDDLYNLKKGLGFHAIVGTPGRIFHLCDLRELITENLKTFILDEADILLGSGFKLDVYNIFRFLPENTQCLLISATFHLNILQLSNKFMKDPLIVLIKRENMIVKKIKQFYIPIYLEENKINTLLNLFDTNFFGKTIIFCNTIYKATWIFQKLIEQNFQVMYLHGKIPQKERNKIFKKFLENEIKILISTDLIARGINFSQVSLIINYDVPFNKDTYLHRIGRIGNYFKTSIIINFLTTHDINKILDLELFYFIQMERVPDRFVNMINYFY